MLDWLFGKKKEEPKKPKKNEKEDNVQSILCRNGSTICLFNFFVHLSGASLS